MGLLALCACGGFLFATCGWPPLDGHPHEMSRLGDFESTTEADHEAAFGCKGRLVEGSRDAGTPYVVEWSDDTFYENISFGPDGKANGRQGGPFFQPNPCTTRTTYDRLRLAMRRWGLNAR
jgi:hypothetical protein